MRCTRSYIRSRVADFVVYPTSNLRIVRSFARDKRILLRWFRIKVSLLLVSALKEVLFLDGISKSPLSSALIFSVELHLDFFLVEIYWYIARQRAMVRALQPVRRSCSINIGLCRDGSSLLRLAFEHFGLTIFQHQINNEEKTTKGLLVNPEVTITKWWNQSKGKDFVLRIAQQYDLICDGLMPFLLFLPREELLHLQSMALVEGVKLNFILTTRNVESIDSFVRSELHHWVINNLEKDSAMDYPERKILDVLLKKRFLAHLSLLQSFSQFLKCNESIECSLFVLPLESVESLWSGVLSSFCWPSQEEWNVALHRARQSKRYPPLPVQGVLITFRIENNKHISEKVHDLLSRIEQDRLCEYLMVIALDFDEFNSEKARNLIQSIASRPRVLCVHTVQESRRNSEEPFPLCQIWDSMAKVAWSNGADWVVLFGDDVLLECPFHYRSIYRSFLDISEQLKCPFGFGSPWLNDEEFPGFPTFPVISKVHFQIFGGLIPYHRKADFVNQDLDPYLCRLYAKFNAAPLLCDVKVRNFVGGDNSRPSRYRRVPAVGWRDWVVRDISPVEDFVKHHCIEVEEQIMFDVVIPTYRLDIQYLRRLCSMRVPNSFKTTFIVVVDNPELLVKRFFGKPLQERCIGFDTSSLAFAAKQLEKELKDHSRSENGGNGNLIRVRFNTTNSGASASRNKGIEESSADYVLFLDDDVIPDLNLLKAYGDALSEVHKSPDAHTLLGMIGLVRFPRSLTMPLKHAAVLSSHLTSIFEIAESKNHRAPAWGVTANLMVKRVPSIRFDQTYSKTGGGEDIDFCLHLQRQGGFFRAVEHAAVVHDYWEGSAFHLAKRFFRWAYSDSEIFNRFPEHRYLSWPNAIECFYFVLLSWTISFSISFCRVASLLSSFVFADVLADVCNKELFSERCASLRSPRSPFFSVAAQALGNLYILAVENGRFFGHVRAFKWKNVSHRYDWHCGRLPGAINAFRSRELRKFVLFFFIAIVLSFL